MTRHPAAPRKRNRAEWTTFLASCAVVAVVVVAIVFVWLSGAADPQVTATVQGAPVQRDGQFIVDVTVKNGGDKSVADVQVSASLAGKPHADQLIDFLSGGESADLVFVFGEKPADLEVEVVSYQDP